MWVQVAAGLGRGHAVEVGREPVTIGSGPGCALVVAAPGVEPLHASLVALDDGRVELRDVSPTPGATFVDREPIDGSRVLEGHEEIRLGESAVVRLTPSEPTMSHDVATDPRLAEGLARDDDEPAPRRRLRALSRSARRATALAALALLVAAGVGVFALTRGGGGGGVTDARASVTEIVKAAAPGIVRVTSSAGRDKASGSGVIVDAGAGLIVTNFHVVNGGNDFTVTVGGTDRPARLVGGAPCEDLALLAVSRKDGLHALALGSEADIEQGEPVVAVATRPAATATRRICRRRAASCPCARRSCGRRTRRRRTSTTSSRPMPRSTPATPAGRSSTPTGM